MKGLKIFAWVFGGLVVLIAVLFALALTPSVQTWAVRKALAGQPGMTIEVTRVAAGFSSAEIADLHYAKDGMVVTAKGVSAKYSAWDYLTKKRINVDSLTVQDLVVDVRNVASTAADATGAPPKSSPGKSTPPPPTKTKAPKTAGAETPFEGLLKQAQLPFAVRVASLSAKGRALLPKEQLVAFDVQGTGIETGQRGKVQWTIDFSDSTKEAALRALRSTGTANLHIAADGRINSVEVDTSAAAMGPNIPPDQIKLTAKAEQTPATGNETYAATVSIVRRNNVEPLLKTTAEYTAARRQIAGTWEIAVKSEQLAALLAGLGLPELAATGTGKFSFNPGTSAVTASGNLQGEVTQLQKLSPSLQAVGSIRFKTTFDGGLAGELARLEKLELEVTGPTGEKLAQISTLQRVDYGLADKRVILANPRAEVARIALLELPLAWAQPVLSPMTIESGTLSLALAVEAEPDGSRIRARAQEPLKLREVTLRDANKKALVEKVTLTTRPNIDYSATRVIAQLAELNISMPTGDSLTGTISANVTQLNTSPVVAFTTQLRAQVVAALKPYFPVETGPLGAEISAEGRYENNVLTISKSSTNVSRDSGALLLAQEILQPIRVELKTSAITVANPSAAAARVRLGEIPLAWAEPFVANSKLSGNVVSGTLEAALRSADDVTLTTTAPLVLKAVTAAMDGKALVQGVDLSADLVATKHGDAITYDLRRIELKQGEAALATVAAKGDAKLGGKTISLVAKGNLDADVAALMKQPALAEYATLSRGRLTVAFDAAVADFTHAKAAITAKDLVAKQDNRVLGDLQLTVDATMKPDGSGTVKMPLTLTSAQRKSDLSVDATFGKAQDKKTFLFTGSIASNNLVVDDLQPLAGLAPSGSKTASPTTTAPSAPAQPNVSAPRPGQPTIVRAPTPGSTQTRPGVAIPTPTSTGERDTEPFWKGANGKVTVDLKRVLYGTDYVINAVRGTAVVTDSKLSLDGLEGRFKENPFKLSGGLTFAPQLPKPYALIASADVQNFDVGEFLRSANPAEKPALETKATITARLNGNGGTIGDVAKNAFGKFEITGTKGVARYLARKGNMGTAVNIASFGLAVLGAARGSDTTMAIAELARALNEVNFDSVKMQVERGADLSFKLTSMELVSPILRMTGSGAVASKSTDDLAKAPMNIVLQLGAKGELGHLLQKTGMLGQQQDEKGYQLMTRSFTVGGTPSNPDSSVLWKMLGEAALGALAR